MGQQKPRRPSTCRNAPHSGNDAHAAAAGLDQLNIKPFPREEVFQRLCGSIFVARRVRSILPDQLFDKAQRLLLEAAWSRIQDRLFSHSLAFWSLDSSRRRALQRIAFHSQTDRQKARLLPIQLYHVVITENPRFSKLDIPSSTEFTSPRLTSWPIREAGWSCPLSTILSRSG